MLELAVEFGGRICAEHGVGQSRRPYVGLSRSPADIAPMEALKRALDPAGLLNPGKFLP